MHKVLGLLIMTFIFVYLHKLQKLLKRERVETYCDQFQHSGQQVRDCVSCINTQKLTSTSLKFYINNINSKFQNVDYYGSIKVLKQEQPFQYSCNSLLNYSDYQLRDTNNHLKQLTFKLESNNTINSKDKQEIDVNLKTGQAAVALRFRVIQPTRAKTSLFTTVRYPHEDITQRLAISLAGSAIAGINYFLLLAFLPGLEGVMQAYMIWCMLQSVMKNKPFPVVYALIYFTLSNLVEIQIYRDLYFLCNILASVIAGILNPTKQSIIGIIITIICVTSQYVFTTKDLVWTSTIMGYYFTLLGQKPQYHDKPSQLNWTPIHV